MLKRRVKKINKRYLLTLTLLFSDSLSVIIAFLLAYLLRDKGIFRFFLDPIQPIEIYLRALPVAILLLLGLFSIFGLYEHKKRITKISEMYTSFRAVTLWILFIMAGSYIYKYNYSRIIVLQLYFFTSFFLIAGRLLARGLQAKLFNNGLGIVNICIIGTGRQAKDIAKRIGRYKDIGLRFVGFVSSAGKKKETIGSLKSLSKIIRKFSIDEVYIADPSFSQNEILTLIAKCKNKGVKFKVISNIFDLITGSVDIANLETIPSLDLSRCSFPQWKKIYKRLFDIIMASIGIILAFPFWLIVAIVIKLESEGSILFIQERLGFNGRSFKIYKFRTMHIKTNPYKKSPINQNDGRITEIGKFLRKTSLDELPQLINILKGEMSFIGPRPEMAFIAKKYNIWEKRRLSVKPGLTGLWQILGRKDLPLSENLEYDFYYINNQSFILDIVIILKTIPIVLFGKGAY